MHSAQRVTPRPLLFFLPFLLCQFLSVALSSCGSTFQCEAVPRPSAIPHLFITNGRVYLSSEGTGLRVLQESSGKQLWQTSRQLAAIDGDQVYLDISQDTSSPLTALRADDGKQLWQKTVEDSSRVISAADGSVYLYQRTNAMLVALNGRDGTERWKNHLDLPSPMGDEDGISVQVSSSVVYVLSIGGQLSAYQEESGSLLWSHTFPSSLSLSILKRPGRSAKG